MKSRAPSTSNRKRSSSARGPRSWARSRSSSAVTDPSLALGCSAIRPLNLLPQALRAVRPPGPSHRGDHAYCSTLNTASPPVDYIGSGSGGGPGRGSTGGVGPGIGGSGDGAGIGGSGDGKGSLIPSTPHDVWSVTLSTGLVTPTRYRYLYEQRRAQQLGSHPAPRPRG